MGRQRIYKWAAMRLQMAAFFIVILFISGCATYQSKVSVARNHLSNHQNEEAIKILSPLAENEGIDQLIYLLDLGSALQADGQFKASNEYYQRADRMTDIKDYLSISKQTASLFLSEEMTQYKGEDFERLLVNVFSAINYMMLRDRESALVEVRRLNDKLNYFRIEEKKEYGQNPAASYLSAMMWEADKNWDSAYIDYERTYKQNPNIQTLKEDLVRLAKKASRGDQLAKWSKDFGIKQKPEWSDKRMGEIILVYQQGWGPRKAERERILTGAGFVSPGFPKLVPVPTNTQRAQLEVFDAATGAEINIDSPAMKVVVSDPIYSVEENAIKTLEAAYAPLIAKRIAAYVAKDLAAKQVKKQNEGLGALLGLAMHIADRADVRQWSFLPQTIQVARLYVKPGHYKVAVKGLSSSGSSTGENKDLEEVLVKPGSKVFLNWRSYR